MVALARRQRTAYLCTLAPTVALLLPILQWLLSYRVGMAPWQPNEQILILVCGLFAGGAVSYACLRFRSRRLWLSALCNTAATVVMAGIMQRFAPPFSAGIPAYEPTVFLLLGGAALLLGAGALIWHPQKTVGTTP